MSTRDIIQAAAGASGPATYVEDVFSTYLYDGTGATQTIINGVDLSTKGGLVWNKWRSGVLASGDNMLWDTVRGANQKLLSNTTDANINQPNGVSFGSSGFTMGANGNNNSGALFSSWTFRKQAKFFDVVTYTGTGASTQTIPHNLGSTPGCIIVKCTSTGATDWRVYHVGLTSAAYTIQLNQTSAQSNQPSIWNSTAPTSSVFSVGGDPSVNSNGDTYVAYLFAHNAGGFGASGTDNVISCGSYIGSGSASGPTVSLGYEPQFLMIKSSTYAGMDWVMFDSMRGLTAGPSSNDAVLYPNANVPENPSYSWLEPTATGFNLNTNTAQVNASGETYIYVAIRRGPMKVPTDGTKVFSPITSSGATGTTLTTNFPVDMLFTKYRSGTASNPIVDRLRGVSTNSTEQGIAIYTNSAGAESGTAGESLAWNNTGFQIPGNWGGISNAFEAFRRAPNFFDVVCYTGTGSATTLNHNLGVAPELIIVKSRSSAGFNWAVYAAPQGATKRGLLNSPTAFGTSSTMWNNTEPTASVFTVGAGDDTNPSAGSRMVAYLFASCPGVSKVGSYTGNGSSQTINCGFAGGARFILIKRTDSTGDWYVWDSARGIVAANDPHLSLNTASAEVTTDDSIDPDSTGFIVNQVAATNINVSSATYIYLAIA